MNKSTFAPFLLVTLLSACASSNDANTTSAKAPEERVYVTGSHIPQHATGVAGSAVQSVSGQDAARMQNGAGQTFLPGHNGQ